MARNAHPEVTRNRILDAAQQLFITKGYEHTSIQNIVDELGDLSKGAIYHHFKSKEDILEELINRDNDVQDDFNESVMGRSDLTALEKFRILWHYSITAQDHVQIMRAAMPMLSDPVSFAANMRIWSKHLPERFLPLIEEGVKDGSIPTAYPREAAELLSLLPNYWLMPYFYPASLSEMEHRVRCLAAMLSAIGVPIFDDELIEMTAKGMMTFDRLPSAACGDSSPQRGEPEKNLPQFVEYAQGGVDIEVDERGDGFIQTHEVRAVPVGATLLAV